MKPDGSTSLAFVNPDPLRSDERPITLGMVTGKLTQGTGTMQGFREDRRNLIKPG